MTKLLFLQIDTTKLMETWVKRLNLHNQTRIFISDWITKMKRLPVIGALVLVFGIAGNVNADLVWKDLNTSDDRLLTLDESTGLEWLDMSMTLGKSVNDVMDSLFGNTDILPLAGVYAGFRYATLSEVTHLYQEAGMTDLDNAWSTDNWVGAHILGQLLGVTDTHHSDPVWIQEAIVIEGPGLAYAPHFVVDDTPTIQAARVTVSAIGNEKDFDVTDNGIASYLVRESAVPIPSANFIADSTSGVAPLTVNFSDESTGDITNWLWDFGDGENSTDQNPTYTYINKGIYTISLTVSGPDGSDSEIKAEYITVSESDGGGGTDEGDEGNTGCFISTTAYGFSVEKYGKMLYELRVSFQRAFSSQGFTPLELLFTSL